ncbi:unnamed protein product, partial [Rotaria sp. Silwood1]
YLLVVYFILFSFWMDSGAETEGQFILSLRYSPIYDIINLLN